MSKTRGEQLSFSDVKVKPVSRVDELHPSSGEGWQRRRSDACGTFLEGESMTEQSHRDSCDINVLMARYERSGEIPVGRDGQPFFGDFTHVGDFHEAQLRVLEAEASFMQLPAKVRSRFDNDPGKLLAFLEDPANRKEAVDLGLINPPAPAAAAAPSEPAAPRSPSAPPP